MELAPLLRTLYHYQYRVLDRVQVPVTVLDYDWHLRRRHRRRIERIEMFRRLLRQLLPATVGTLTTSTMRTVEIEESPSSTRPRQRRIFRQSRNPPRKRNATLSVSVDQDAPIKPCSCTLP